MWTYSPSAYRLESWHFLGRPPVRGKDQVTAQGKSGKLSRTKASKRKADRKQTTECVVLQSAPMNEHDEVVPPVSVPKALARYLRQLAQLCQLQRHSDFDSQLVSPFPLSVNTKSVTLMEQLLQQLWLPQLLQQPESEELMLAVMQLAQQFLKSPVDRYNQAA